VNLLLDTHVWLWMLTSPERLADARPLVADPGTVLYLSAASSWEIAIKVSLGRLALPDPVETYVPSRIQSTGVTPLAIEHSHVLAVASLPHLHRDPFDRLLVAQAQVENLTIVTADPALPAYPVETLFIQ
jgi:PIN domain nuclease of toxin-antitoxin system